MNPEATSVAIIGVYGVGIAVLKVIVYLPVDVLDAEAIFPEETIPPLEFIDPCARHANMGADPLGEARVAEPTVRLPVTPNPLVIYAGPETLSP